jgi:hypothetical protein
MSSRPEPNKPHLLVAKHIDSGRIMDYCFETQPGLTQDLAAWLMVQGR